MKRFKTCLPMVFLLVTCTWGLTAKASEAIEIPSIDTPPVIDGKLDDPVWSSAVRFEAFKSFKPDYGKAASEETVIYGCSDRENFYFAARCFQKDATRIKATVTHRDNMFGDDWVAVCIDTFSDFQSAYGFLVNPLGIQGDGILNSSGDLDGSHDMVWYSKGSIDDQGYTVEIKIPFKSIRFPIKKEVKMGIWLVRNIVRTSENVCFPEIFPDKGAILSQAQSIVVRNMKYQRIVELLPAFTHSRTRAHLDGEWTEEERQTDFSLTGKLGLTPSLVLDATYNPDFSQVEADAGQVDVNLRYALFYQEKRPFFLEGIEEFQFAGNTEDAPLYAIVHTRTIIDPFLGLKLSGKLGRKNSLASILAIDEPPALNGESGTGRATFGILRFRHAFKKDTYAGGFFTAREVSGGYNRVAGIDGRFRLSGSAKAEYHLLGSLSKNPDTGDTNSGHALGLRYDYSTRQVFLDIGLQDISRDFRVDSGFLTRQGLTRLAGFGMYRFYPKSKFFQSIDTFYWSYHILDKASDLFETFNLFTFRLNLPRTSMARFDVSLANEVFAGKRFDTSGVRFMAESQITRQFYFFILYWRGGRIFYDPDNPFPGKSNSASLTLQYQPLEKFTTSLDLTYEDFYRRTDSRKEYDYTILRSRTTFQLNKYLFFRGIAEYNFYREKLLLDVLASFTYIPGTVVHIGYGSILEKTRWDMNLAEYVPASRFQEIHRAFFFKVSYLWRL
jgi:hypothetical protein